MPRWQMFAAPHQQHCFVLLPSPLRTHGPVSMQARVPIATTTPTVTTGTIIRSSTDTDYCGATLGTFWRAFTVFAASREVPA